MSEQQKNEQSEKSGMKKSGWYRAARIAAAVLFNTVGPVRYHNAESLPEKGPFILIANHSSWMDPIVMAKPIKKVDVTFLGKKELVQNPLAYKILMNMHMIMVDRHHSDMEAMRSCTKALRAGEILGIFPEGTRRHEGLMTEIESGVALIALRANVPLIPMYITPKYRLLRTTHCYVGAPIDFSDLREEGVNRESCEKLLNRITETYAQMAQAAAKQK